MPVALLIIYHKNKIIVETGVKLTTEDALCKVETRVENSLKKSQI